MIRLILVMLFSISLKAHASYELTELEATPLDVPDIINTVNWDNTDTGYPNDDDKLVVNIGFTFTFDDTDYTQVRILTNGLLHFGTDQRLHRDYTNETLATDEGDRLIAVYWDDLVDDSSSSVTYGNAGVSPNRRFIVNWTNVKAYSNNLRYDFQVVLYENGDIRYRYNNNTANGESATIGLEINDSEFVQYSYNQVSVETSFDLLFRNSLLFLPNSVAEYRFDEVTYNGTSGEVKDSSGNSLNGNSFGLLNTQDISPAIPGEVGSCRYGKFNGNDQYAEISDNNLLDFQNNFSAAAWIKINSIPSSGLITVLSKDENYEFHVNSSGQINWWWRNSSGAIRQINSDVTITPGIWTHIVISYEPGNQIIYVNGNPSGGASFNENLSRNSDPLQIGADQNLSGRFFDGDIDEVNIFDQFLNQSQVRELIDRTRPCVSANLCVGSFPDGISTHADNGEITFGLNSQLFFSPDDRLNTTDVNLSIFSSKRSCVTTDCQANSNPVPTTDAPAFPDTSSFTEDVTVPDAGTLAIGLTSNEYRTIRVGDQAVLQTVTGQTDFYMDRLVTNDDSVLNLVAANYWIRDLDLGRATTINVVGSGTVRIYVQTNTNVSRNLMGNSAGLGQAGDASRLLIYGYGNLEFQRNSTISGTVYAVGNLELNRDSFLYGAMAGANVILRRNTKVYYLPSAVENTDFGGLCEPASCQLGSFQITQPTYALACPFSRNEIQIQAMCDDGTTTKDDYAGTIALSSNESALSRFYDNASSGTPITDVTLDGTESGLTSVFLFHQNENNALAVIASDTVNSVSTTSVNTTDVRTDGFALTEVADFECGGSTAFTMTAIGDDTTGTPCQILTGFTGTKNLKSWFNADLNPAHVGNETASSDLIVNGSALRQQQSAPTANNISLDFTSGVANITVQYPNAAEIETLNFIYDEAPYGTAPLPANLVGTTNTFVATPSRVTLGIAATSSNCPYGDYRCSPFVAAGQNFSVTATAQCSNGATATDYIGAVNLSHSLLAPSGGRPGTLSLEGTVIDGVTLKGINIDDSDEGSQTFNLSVSEVGVFNFISTPDAYFDATITANTLDKVGRFYPSYFSVTAPVVTAACGSFTYMSQDELSISFTATAMNVSGVKTENYTGNFAIAASSLVVENNNDGSDMGGRLSNVSTGNWSDGIMNYVDGDIAFDRSALGPDGPYQALQLGLQLSDSEASLSGLNMNAATTGICSSCNALLLGVTDVRFGTLSLANAFGPETMALDQRVEMRYYDGSRFIINQDDDGMCYTLSASTPPLIAGSYTGNLSPGDTSFSISQAIHSGIGFIRYNAPGVGNDGTLSVRYEVPLWLKTEYGADGNSNNYEENPAATITFGQFRGNDRVLYWREITN